MSIRLGPQFQDGALIPKAPNKKEFAKRWKPVWWKVVRKDGTTKFTHHIKNFSDDARKVIALMAENYPSSICVSITRMKRKPK